MNYSVFYFSFSNSENFIADLLAAQLGEIGFESFVPVRNGLEAYVQTKKMKGKEIDKLISGFEYDKNMTYTVRNVEDENWNEEWEKYYFKPIVIDDRCVIHSSFHRDYPMVKYDLIIDPKMAFGTGHHETTSLMVSEILDMDIAGKKVLDMGCGTSVLAILASMRGAEEVTAIDIDDWCVENSTENIRLNNVSNIKVLLGDASLLPGRSFDIILANINRNILQADMHIYADCLTKGGVLYMSGFYTEDIPALVTEAKRNGLEVNYSKEKNNWATVRAVKVNSDI